VTRKVPSENGNRTDCGWAAFRHGENGPGVCIVSTSTKKSTFNFSASLNTQQELHDAFHTSDLEERKNGESEIYVNVDHKLMGLAGDVR